MRIAVYILSLLAIYAIVQRQDAADVEYTKSLEVTLGKCLSDSTGRVVLIDREVFLCGIVSTGERM